MFHLFDPRWSRSPARHRRGLFYGLHYEAGGGRCKSPQNPRSLQSGSNARRFQRALSPIACRSCVTVALRASPQFQSPRSEPPRRFQLTRHAGCRPYRLVSRLVPSNQRRLGRLSDLRRATISPVAGVTQPARSPLLSRSGSKHAWKSFTNSSALIRCGCGPAEGQTSRHPFMISALPTTRP